LCIVADVNDLGDDTKNNFLYIKPSGITNNSITDNSITNSTMAA